jgi:hypothetical protein
MMAEEEIEIPPEVEIETAAPEVEIETAAPEIEVETAAPENTGIFRLSFTPQEFVDLYDTFAEDSSKPNSKFRSAEQGFAFSLVESLKYDPYLSDKVDYNLLRTGEAPILSELGLEGQALTDKQIIELFAQDDQGRDIEADPGFFQGVKRRALPGLGFAAGFAKGAQGGNVLVAGVPPVTPWTAAVRIGVPIFTGTAGGVAASFAGEKATDVLMGSEPIVLPGASAYEAGKTFSDTLPFVLTPWAVPAKGFSLGGQQALNQAQNFIGPIMKGQTRSPLSARFVSGVEKISGGMGRLARENPYRTAAVEGGALIGTTLLAGKAEDVAPGNPWVRFGFETTGGISGALLTDLAANRVPALTAYAYRGAKKLYNRIFNKTPDELQQRYGISEGDMETVATFITQQLEKNQEDPLAILETLNDPRFDRFLTAEDGSQIQLDPATRAASVTLLGLQNQFASANPSIGADATSRMKSSIDALRRGLLALYADGSSEALQDAAIIQTALFEGVLDSKLALATNNTIEAFQRIADDSTGADLEAAQNIFDTLTSQYKAGRAEETVLWKKIPDNLEVNQFIDETGNAQDIPNFITNYNENIGNILQEVKDVFEGGDLKVLKRFVERKTDDLGIGKDAADGPFDTGVTIGELNKARSAAMGIGKKLLAESRNNEARIAFDFADSLLADMNSMPLGQNQAYDTARSFSAAFNDVFTKAYAGEVLGTLKNGAPKVPIEILANNLMKGDAAFMKAAALDGVAQFQTGQALTNLLESETGGQFADQGQRLLADLQEQYDPVTGVINLPEMRKWYSRNQDLIQTIPNLNGRIVAAINTANDIRAGEETLLRTLRANTLNEDGSLNTGALSNWMNNQNNKRLLEMFPGIRDDLQDVRKASNLIEQIRQKNKFELKNADDQVGLSALLPDKTSNATTAVTSAISANQNRPFAILNRYMRMINNVGEDGFTVLPNTSGDQRFISPNSGKTWTQDDLKNGLRSALYDTIFQVSANGERFSPAAAFNKMFVPHKNGNGVSVADWMLENKLVGADQLEDTKQFLQKMAEIEMFTMKAKPGQTDEFYKDLGEGFKLVAAMGGSAVGSSIRSKIGLNSGAGEIVFAGRFAKFGQDMAQRYFAELPQSLQANRVQMVLENEELLKQALRKGKTQREKNALAAQFAELAIQNYIIMPVRRLGGEIIQETFSRDQGLEGQELPPVEAAPVVPVEETAPQASLQPVPQFMDRESRQLQGAGTPPTMSPPPAAPAPAPSGPVDRSQYAALFPTDITSSLIRAQDQGIGSLRS